MDVPDCNKKKIWQCDSVWVFGAYGAREEKQENCREEEIEDCKLVKKSVVTSYPKYHCEADTPIKYVRPIYDGRNVNRYSRRCEAKALPVCHPKLEARCTTVTYQECDETWQRTSIDIVTWVPYQDYDHRLKCHVEH